ncbi:Eukaryotic peptide chain release factor GTP-binding subunit ERF3A [Manis javanica]|nr:Eukaryotic peptide chain release factor GTP-binding subunit ERF3A [Manis javanica]
MHCSLVIRQKLLAITSRDLLVLSIVGTSRLNDTFKILIASKSDTLFRLHDFINGHHEKAESLEKYFCEPPAALWLDLELHFQLVHPSAILRAVIWSRHCWVPRLYLLDPKRAPVAPSQEEQSLCEGSNSAVSMELSETVVENGETKMSPEESWEHKEETNNAEPVGGSLGGAPKNEHVYVVFIGHVDAGKSTIGGQIIHTWLFSAAENIRLVLCTSSNSYEDTHHSFQSGKAERRGPGSRRDMSGKTKDPPMNDPAHSSFVPPHKSK